MSRASTRSRSKWDRILKRFSKSGLTRREFCEREGLSYSTFSSAVSRRKQGLVLSKERSLTTSHQKTCEFVEVEFAPLPAPPTTVEPEVVVELPMGVVLKFRGLS